MRGQMTNQVTKLKGYFPVVRGELKKKHQKGPENIPHHLQMLFRRFECDHTVSWVHLHLDFNMVKRCLIVI